MNKAPNLLYLIVPLLALAVFGVFGAKYMVNAHSEATLERLAIVWPAVASMPDAQRNLLVELALICNVVEREPVRAEVIDCLRSTAVKMPPPAAERLERLVAQAPQPQP